MFESHELVYTHDPKTGQYSGGGYALKSELLSGGAPALIAVSGGGRKNRRRNSESGNDLGSGSGSGSGSDSDSNSGNKLKPKVSSLITNNRSSIVIPAGLFLIHGPACNNNMAVSNDNNSDNEDSAFTTNAKLRSFLYNSESDADDTMSDSGDEERGVDRRVRKDNNVIPDDLYTALFKMLSPNESDKKRYWVGSAVTRRHPIRQKPEAAAASANKTTRKHKK
jgi:hypothetical protein